MKRKLTILLLPRVLVPVVLVAASVVWIVVVRTETEPAGQLKNNQVLQQTLKSGSTHVPNRQPVVNPPPQPPPSTPINTEDDILYPHDPPPNCGRRPYDSERVCYEYDCVKEPCIAPNPY
ncbi:hypothetical protein H0X09_03160 [Candidatus Saccharibacteria bacterium]|nr:hypothetical protein [Candidatus Saccharibacteria bacterium]